MFVCDKPQALCALSSGSHRPARSPPQPFRGRSLVPTPNNWLERKTAKPPSVGHLSLDRLDVELEELFQGSEPDRVHEKEMPQPSDLSLRPLISFPSLGGGRRSLRQTPLNGKTLLSLSVSRALHTYAERELDTKCTNYRHTQAIACEVQSGSLHGVDCTARNVSVARVYVQLP